MKYNGIQEDRLKDAITKGLQEKGIDLENVKEKIEKLLKGEWADTNGIYDALHLEFPQKITFVAVKNGNLEEDPSRLGIVYVPNKGVTIHGYGQWDLSNITADGGEMVLRLDGGVSIHLLIAPTQGSSK